jgi:UDP-glucose 4-epimerase
MKTYLITGVCGFIGSNLAFKLLSEGHKVIGIDRFDKRHDQTIEELSEYINFKLYTLDLSKPFAYQQMMYVVNGAPIDMVFHLAANADVRFSSVYPDKDINDGIIATYNVLRFLSESNIKKIAYSSTSAIYGIVDKVPTPENCNFIQTSFYGASKVAGEALIQAHCAAHDAQAWIFRYASITGPRYSHGFIYNFYNALTKDPHELYVHGGKDQRKTYLDVEDCVNAMLTIVEKSNERINTFNIGNVETCSLTESIPIITEFMKVRPNVVWSGNEVGWVGDSKINDLDITKLKNLGWAPKHTIKDTILRTLNWLDNNKWILNVRDEL